MKRLVWVAGIVIGLPLVWIGVSGWLSARQERANAGRVWISSGLTIEQAAQRFPKTVTSPAALEIEAAGNRMGIPFAYRRPPGPPEQKVFSKLNLGTFVEAAIGSGDDAVPPTPPAIAAFLASHAQEIAAIRAAATGQLEWHTDIGAAFRGTVPSLMGHRGVQNLLAADALDRLSKRDVKGALECVEAGWRINDALRRRPELLSQIVAAQLDANPLGVLRKVRRAATGWSERVLGHDHRDSTRMAEQVETWMFSEAARGPVSGGAGPAGPPGVGRMMRAPLERSFVRLWTARHTRLMWQLDGQIHAIGPCALDKAGADSVIASYSSGWNLRSRSIVKSYVRTLQQAVRRSLDAELTRKILDSDALTGTGTLPSSVCAGVNWQYRATPHEISLAIDRDPLAGTGVRGLPLSFTGRR